MGKKDRLIGSVGLIGLIGPVKFAMLVPDGPRRNDGSRYALSQVKIHNYPSSFLAPGPWPIA